MNIVWRLRGVVRVVRFDIMTMIKPAQKDNSSTTIKPPTILAERGPNMRRTKLWYVEGVEGRVRRLEVRRRWQEVRQVRVRRA